MDGVFRTPDGIPMPAVTASQMREVDRIAVDEVGLGLLEMMENAGRNLAGQALMFQEDGPVVIIAGAGGNGGGGLACARHLVNRDVPVQIVLDRPPDELAGAPATQYAILDAMDIPVTTQLQTVTEVDVLVDALIGYGLRDAPRENARRLIRDSNDMACPVLSLDVPSGLDATTGETPGVAIQPDRTLTLALPKTGLCDLPGELYVGDIGIPSVVFEDIGLSYQTPYRDDYWIKLIFDNTTAKYA